MSLDIVGQDYHAWWGRTVLRSSTSRFKTFKIIIHLYESSSPHQYKQKNQAPSDSSLPVNPKVTVPMQSSIMSCRHHRRPRDAVPIYHSNHAGSNAEPIYHSRGHRSSISIIKYRNLVFKSSSKSSKYQQRNQHAFQDKSIIIIIIIIYSNPGGPGRPKTKNKDPKIKGISSL